MCVCIDTYSHSINVKDCEWFIFCNYLGLHNNQLEDLAVWSAMIIIILWVFCTNSHANFLTGSYTKLIVIQLLVLLLWYSSCFSFCCHKILYTNNLRKKGFLLPHCLGRDTVHSVVAGAQDSWSHCLHSQEAERWISVSTLFLSFIQSLTPAQRIVFIFRTNLHFIVKSFWKYPHRHTQRFVDNED